MGISPTLTTELIERIEVLEYKVAMLEAWSPPPAPTPRVSGTDTADDDALDEHSNSL